MQKTRDLALKRLGKQRNPVADGAAGGRGQVKLTADVGGDDALRGAFLKVGQLASAQGLGHGGLEERVGPGGAAAQVTLGDGDTLHAYGVEDAFHNAAHPLAVL